MKKTDKAKEKYKKVLEDLEYQWNIAYNKALQRKIDKEELGKCMERLNKHSKKIIDKGFRDIL